MVFWSRNCYSRIKSLNNQCKIHCSTYTMVPLHGGAITSAPASANNHISAGLFRKVRVFDRTCLFDRYQLYGSLRFFAAPVLANKPNPEPKVEKGIRLNDKIKAEFIRLVTDDGHTVVSRREALDRARNLKLDLVEVDRCANPPVCKIMDYHREKYKKQVTEKEKIKSKANGALRKSSPKEVRFTAKTDQKDLQTKAEQVKRLMEKGYRVKCMAVGTEDQDLDGLLARLSALIEDVSVVESGPMVEKKQAYSVVRHIKFGLLKKGSSKKISMPSTSQSATLNPEPAEGPVEIEEEFDDSKSYSESENDIDPGQIETTFTSTDLPRGDLKKTKTAWSTADTNEDFEGIFGFDENKSVASSSITRQIHGVTDHVFPLEDVSSANLPYSKPEQESTNSNVHSRAQGPTQVCENRYSGKSDVRSRFQPTKSTGRLTENTNFSPVQATQVNRGPGATVTTPQGPTQVIENRYGGRSEVRNRFRPTMSTERLTENTKFSPLQATQVNSGAGATVTIPQGPTQAVENRYGGRTEVRSRFQPSASSERTTDNSELSEFSTIHTSVVNRGPGATNTVPQGPTQVAENRYGGRSEGRSRIQPTDEALRPEQSNLNAHNSQRPGFGIFSAPKHAVLSRPSVATEVNEDRGNSSLDPLKRPGASGMPLNIDAEPRSEDNQRPESNKTGKYGIFGGGA